MPHITSSEDELAHGTEYTGSEKVLANGMGLKISSISHSQLLSQTHHKPLFLDKLLHVPQISKNLFSVSKFATDNNTYFEFFPTVCFVRDQVSRAILLQGKLQNGLCLRQISTSAKQQVQYTFKSSLLSSLNAFIYYKSI